jgi:phage-related protein (TIGR01555 family)
MKFFTTVEESLKWSRLFGGALAVMIIDDGINDLTKPVNWKKAKKIDEIVVYDRSVVTPDYQSMYRGVGVYGTAQRSKFRMPDYNVFSIYGSFRVHESRCLIFRNGKMPEKASTSDYRFWGVPEYNHIKRAMRETITAHGDAVKLLERSVQAVYKTKNLAQMLSTDEGENDVLRRLQLIDTARGILNSIAIDADGEDYDFKTITLSGVKEVIDSACNMLSALTEIPQTKLFGRSPAGMNATGESDLENYYSFIDKIRESQIKDNLCSLIDGIIQIGINNKELTERPDYELEFESLWNEKESERATIDQTRAQTDLTIAQTAQLYIDMGVLDPAEERKRLKNEGKFGIEDEELPQQEEEPLAGLLQSLQRKDSKDSPYKGATGVGVLVVKDGKFLVGNRDDNNQVGSPGGHIESWEDAERAAMRETEEEFGITLKNLIPLGMLDNLPQEYGRSFAFLSTDFDGTPLTNTQEMLNNRFTELQGLQNEVLYEPFKAALDKLFSVLEINAMYSDDEDDTPKDVDTDEADTPTDNADAEADDNASEE